MRVFSSSSTTSVVLSDDDALEESSDREDMARTGVQEMEGILGAERAATMLAGRMTAHSRIDLDGEDVRWSRRCSVTRTEGTEDIATRLTAANFLRDLAECSIEIYEI